MSVSDSFSEVEGKAWGGLMRMHGRMLQRMEADLVRHSQLTSPEFEVLLQLSWASDGRLRMLELARNSLLTRSGMSRLLTRLERAGLLHREGTPDDERGAVFRLTAAGQAKFKAAKKKHVAFVREQFLRHFSKKELALMVDFWQRVSAEEE